MQYQIDRRELGGGLEGLAASLDVAVEDLMRVLGPALNTYWKSLADFELDSTRERYKKSIKKSRRVGKYKVIMSLGKLPEESSSARGIAQMVEEGAESYDMRNTLIPIGDTHTVVPFDVKSGGKPRGATLPGRPYKPVLGSTPAAKIGRQVREKMAKMAIGDRLAQGTAPILHPHHSKDIYAGLRKEESGFTSYRTITTDTNVGGWIHPGIKEHDLLGKITYELESEASNMLKNYLELSLQKKGIK